MWTAVCDHVSTCYTEHVRVHRRTFTELGLLCGHVSRIQALLEEIYRIPETLVINVI
jgi:hypothetical protein